MTKFLTRRYLVPVAVCHGTASLRTWKPAKEVSRGVLDDCEITVEIAKKLSASPHPFCKSDVYVRRLREGRACLIFREHTHFQCLASTESFRFLLSHPLSLFPRVALENN